MVKAPAQEVKRETAHHRLFAQIKVALGSSHDNMYPDVNSQGRRNSMRPTLDFPPHGCAACGAMILASPDAREPLVCRRPDLPGIRGRRFRRSATGRLDARVSRHSLDGLLRGGGGCNLGVPALALFPVVEQDRKSTLAEEAYNPEGLVPRVLQAVKARFPELGLITDVALDPYTSHGQDGLIDPDDPRGYVLNDETLEVLAKQALCHAQAGADVVAPSDMMDGRLPGFGPNSTLTPASIPESRLLGQICFQLLWSFSGCCWFGGKPRQGQQAYLSDGPCKFGRSRARSGADIAEGADMFMVKPGMPYLDIVRRVKSGCRCRPTSIR